ADALRVARRALPGPPRTPPPDRRAAAADAGPASPPETRGAPRGLGADDRRDRRGRDRRHPPPPAAPGRPDDRRLPLASPLPTVAGRSSSRDRGARGSRRGSARPSTPSRRAGSARTPRAA